MKIILNNLHKTLPLTAVATLLLVGCASTDTSNQTSQATPSAAAVVKLRPEQTLATVNGQPIGKSAMPQGKNAPTTPEMEDRMIEELIARELIAQDFVQKDMAKDPAIAEQLANMNRVTFSQLASEKYISGLPVSDAELHKFYDQKSPEMVSQQFKLRHILLDNQDVANTVITELQKGAKFEKLAKKLSKDSGTQNTGGDLGWVDPRALGPNFSHALEQMKNGDVATQPIQSQYGWHVILREDVRTQPAPAFDAIKDKLASAVRMEKFQEHIKELRAKAQISRSSKPALSK